MLDIIKYLETKTEKYPLAFTLNVMEIIQEKYGSIEKWSELIQKQGEPDIKALKFFITEAINEGIEIENEKKDEKRKAITNKKAGRILTEIGLNQATKAVAETITESIQTSETKNESTTKSQIEKLIFRGFYLLGQKCSDFHKKKLGV